MNDSDKTLSQNTMPGCDPQINFQKTARSIIFLQLIRNVVCQDQCYSTKICCFVLLQTSNLCFAKLN